MSLDATDIILSLIFAIIGFFYVFYGRRTQNFWFMISGLGLMAYTLVTSTTQEVIWYGIAMIIVPFILDRLF